MDSNNLLTCDSVGCPTAALLLSTRWQNEALTITVSYEELPDFTFFSIPKIKILVLIQAKC